MPPFIYINGYPGVGKLTVAKELSKLIPMSKVVDNHLLIDPVAAMFERDAEEYRPLRKALRQECLKAIATSTSTKEVTWIFTDQQSSNSLGSESARDHQHAAAVRGSKFISVILLCELEENLRRAQAEGRGGLYNTKLTDISTVRSIREREDIFHFHDEWELELDVTNISSVEAAEVICNHISKLQQRE